jgi:hypothetical protein
MNAEKRESEEIKEAVNRVITSNLSSSDLRESLFIRG